jgi:hypothetical protein
MGEGQKTEQIPAVAASAGRGSSATSVTTASGSVSASVTPLSMLLQRVTWRAQTPNGPVPAPAHETAG